VLRGDPGTPELRAQEAILAPRTARELLPKVDRGDMRDLPRVTLRVQPRVRAQQTRAPCTLELDSRSSEQASTRKQGSTKASKGPSGYPPLLAGWAEEGEVLCSQLRRGSAPTSRTGVWFLAETFKRMPAQAASALRADRGFYRKEVGQWGEAYHVRCSSTADQTAPLRAVSEALPDHACINLPADYPLSEGAEGRSQPARWTKAYRSVGKRQLPEKKNEALSWHSHGFVTTDETPPALELEGWHRQQAARDKRINEQKSGVGLEKLPTGGFPATWASLLLGQLALNLAAWFKKLVLPASYQRATLQTLRHHRLNWAGKIVHSARPGFLVLSDRYRSQAVWQVALGRLAHLQFS
jgi:hypothetical protein